MRQNNRSKMNMGLVLGYLYILIPFVLFIIGWCKWYVWVPALAVILYTFAMMCKDSREYPRMKWNAGTIQKWVFILLLIALWVYLSGIGKLVFQNNDHSVRNGIYELMVNDSWPMVRWMDETGSLRAHIYYIGYWLPAAAFGKVFGIQAGYYFQMFWAVLGISLAYYFVCWIRKRVEIWPLVVFILFSGLDIVGSYLLGTMDFIMSTDNTIEWWTLFYQYSSHTTQLFWVYNQCVPAWIALMLLYVQKDNRFLILILSTLVLPSTFPFAGMVAFVIAFACMNSMRNKGEKKFLPTLLRSVFSIPNVLAGGLIGITSTLYVLNSDVLRKAMPEQMNRLVQSFTTTVYAAEQSAEAAAAVDYRAHALFVILFLLLEAGVYLIAVYKYQNRNPLFWVTLIMLCICPFVKIGSTGDFCMRASIPAIQMLYLLVIDTIDKAHKEKNRMVITGLVVILAIGAFGPLFDMERTIRTTADRYIQGQQLDIDNTGVEGYLYTGDYVSGSATDGLFFKYLADVPSEKE